VNADISILFSPLSPAATINGVMNVDAVTMTRPVIVLLSPEARTGEKEQAET
jgi:hypothetical protein